MSNSTELETHHQQLEQLLDGAEKAMPFNAIGLAKRAARKSHQLLGALINHFKNQAQALDYLNQRVKELEKQRGIHEKS
ncbi:hypothetical protein G3R49_19685 [Shewanella sp. WXL01]|uniref:hypothetical protein n=1 Tax=Shewanella sp. WXL01 TaxID=2709721 RepID=UPI0014385698|nr:hypothetical protein [Shewanella sp. WXL01]NKF52782.1 hypothetical protein [Shewanella sp. WXL01]